MYKTLKELLEKAEKFNYTVGSFNMHNLEMLPPMIMAAKDMGAPIIIQTSAGAAEYIGYASILQNTRAWMLHSIWIMRQSSMIFELRLRLAIAR